MNSETSLNAKTITVIIILSSFSSAFLGSAMNIVIPSLSADLSISAGRVGWVITVYSLTTCGLSVPFGKLADATGKNRIFLLGVGILTLSCFATGWVRSFALLIVLRILQGVGASMIFATNTAIIVACHPPQQRGKAIGHMLSGTYVGLASGPVLAGVLNQWFGWHSVFFATAAVGAAALIPACRYLPVKERQPLPGQSPGQPGPSAGKQPDIAGNLLFIAMITCGMYGFASIGRGWWPFALIAAGILLGFFFVRRELAADDPVIDVRIFRSTPAYTLSNLAALFNYCAIFSIQYFMSLYLQVDKGYSSQTAGLILICLPVVMASLTSRAGALSDRIAPYKLATAGMVVCGCTMIVFSMVQKETPVWAIVCTLLIAGLGVSLFSSPNMNAIMSCVGREHYGVASSILATMRTLGQTSGIAITTIVISARLGDATLAEAPLADFEGAMRTCFLISAVICFCGAVMSLKRKDT
ncbi:MAG: MFS transporter [Firmicutes bacterium]|nr:MFS transporter [Bacillota bacterium]